MGQQKKMLVEEHRNEPNPCKHNTLVKIDNHPNKYQCVLCKEKAQVSFRRN